MLRVYRVSEGMRAPHLLAIEDVSAALLAGSLALVPTETVYGIGVAIRALPADALQASSLSEESAYRRIFSLKQRELEQTVPWLVGGEEDLSTYGSDVDEGTRALARTFWPGALTLVVKASPVVPPFLRAADGTVALRASASPVIRELIHACASPLAVTSANTHGAPAPSSFDEVELRVLQGVDIAIDAGATPCHGASTIVSCVRGRVEVLREGAIPADQIEAALDTDAAHTQRGA